VEIDAQVLEDVGRDPGPFFNEAEQDVFGPDVPVAEPLRLLVGELHDLPGPVRESLVHVAPAEKGKSTVRSW
jgi:hypothetical protein